MKKIKKIKIKINGKIKSIIQDSNLSMVLKNLKIPLNKVAIAVSHTHLRAHETPEHRGWRHGG